MLAHSREYTDGKYYYAVIPFEGIGHVIILEDTLAKETLKKYFTEDDESAIAVFESMIQLQEERGNEELKNYKLKERLQLGLTDNVRVDKE
jgi:hypothetical protein